MPEHQRQANTASGIRTKPVATVSERAGHPETDRLLDRLHRAVSHIEEGDSHGYPEFESAWRLAEVELEAELIEQLRQDYLRHALALWESCLADSERNPEAALVATDFLCLLFDE